MFNLSYNEHIITLLKKIVAQNERAEANAVLTNKLLRQLVDQNTGMPVDTIYQLGDKEND